MRHTEWQRIAVGLTLMLGYGSARPALANDSSRSFQEASRKLQQAAEFLAGPWINKDRTDREAARGAKAPTDMSAFPTLNRLLGGMLGDGRGAIAPPREPGGGTDKITVKDDVPKLEGRPGNTGKDGGSGGVGKGRAIPQALPYWMPYCFLAEPGAKVETVNGGIRSIVEAYAKCGVVVEPFAYTVNGVPGDQAAATAAARQSCPFNEALGVRGAIQVDTTNANIPKVMCEDQQATGCSTLCEPLSVSFVGPAAGPIVALHESLHGNCCGRLCVNAGEGVEPCGPGIDCTARVDLEPPVKLYWAEEGGNLQAADIAPTACASIRVGAAPNDGTHVFVPDRERYYAVADAEKQVRLGESIFKNRRPPPPPLDGQPKDESGKDTSLAEGGGRVQFDEGPKGQAPQYGGAPGVAKGGANAKNGGGGPSRVRHNNTQQGGGEMILAGSRVTPDIDSVPTTNPAALGGGAGDGGSKIGFADETPKGQGGGGGGGGGRGRGRGFGGGGGGGGSASAGIYAGNDESAVGAILPASSLPGGGASGGSSGVGYDDEAPKGMTGGAGGSAGGAGGGAGGGGAIAGGESAPSGKFPGGNRARNKARGKAMKNARKRTFSRQTDTIISARPAPDFQVDPNFVNAVDVGYSGGGGGGEGGGE